MKSPRISRRAAPLICIVALASTALSGCGLWPKGSPKPTPAKGPVRTVASVDLPRVMGDWRVIAQIPAHGDKARVDQIQSFTLRPDGKIEAWLTFRKRSFDAPQDTIKSVAQVVNRETNAEWRVKLLGMTRDEFLIIDVDAAYQWMVVGDSSRRSGRILARDRALPENNYEIIMDRLAVRGFDPSRFVRVKQFPDQVIGAD